MGRTAILGLSAAWAILCATGCAPQDKFQSETFRLAQGDLQTKGWLRGDRLGVLVRLQPRGRNISLHSIALVSADGESRSPTTWTDKTPEQPTLGLGLGVGIPLGGGHGKEPGHRVEEPVEGGRGGQGRVGGDGGGFRLLPGMVVPLNPARKDRAITAVEASWQLAADGAAEALAGCTMEVKLVEVREKRIDMTTVPLAMTCRDDEPEEGTAAPVPTTAPAVDERKEDRPAQPETSARDLVREIDFTLKAPPRTKSMSL
jgi:hypothetical protein